MKKRTNFILVLLLVLSLIFSMGATTSATTSEREDGVTPAEYAQSFIDAIEPDKFDSHGDGRNL